MSAECCNNCKVAFNFVKLEYVRDSFFLKKVHSVLTVFGNRNNLFQVYGLMIRNWVHYAYKPGPCHAQNWSFALETYLNNMGTQHG
jgi:hypothetical protein